MMWGRRGKRCECRDDDRGGERIVKLSQSGEREELEVEEKLGGGRGGEVGQDS